MVEAGCQGTMRAMVRIDGRAGALGPVLARGQRDPRAPARCCAGSRRTRRAGSIIDGCEYREGLNAVAIRGGVAGNVIPDRCEIEVNYRFAPDRTPAQAPRRTCAEVFDGLRGDGDRLRRPARCPGWRAAPAQEFLAAVGAAPVGKLGWTDVARFAALGIPALNFGPGDPNLAHARDEHVEIGKIRSGRGDAAADGWLLSAVVTVGVHEQQAAAERAAAGQRRPERHRGAVTLRGEAIPA